jgi:hypothetical protein
MILINENKKCLMAGIKKQLGPVIGANGSGNGGEATMIFAPALGSGHPTQTNFPVPQECGILLGIIKVDVPG